MWRIGIVVTAAVLILSSGYLHGLWTNRWGSSAQLEAAIARMSSIPITIGDWQGHPETLSETETQAAGIDGYCARRYENRQNGQAITVLLMCGRPGPLAVHTPDGCYHGAGFQTAAQPAKEVHKFTPGPAASEFWGATFQKGDSGGPKQLRILWSWNAGGNWLASDDPRLTFAHAPALYKLYLVQPLTSAQEGHDEEVRNAFLAQLMPELEKALFVKS